MTLANDNALLRPGRRRYPTATGEMLTHEEWFEAYPARLHRVVRTPVGEGFRHSERPGFIAVTVMSVDEVRQCWLVQDLMIAGAIVDNDDAIMLAIKHWHRRTGPWSVRV